MEERAISQETPATTRKEADSFAQSLQKEPAMVTYCLYTHTSDFRPLTSRTIKEYIVLFEATKCV